MKRSRILDADKLKLSDEYSIVFRTNIQRALCQEVAAIRRALVRNPGQTSSNRLRHTARNIEDVPCQ